VNATLTSSIAVPDKIADLGLASINPPAGMLPRLAIVSCALPPQLDGIGDHSSGLAHALADRAEVSIHTVGAIDPLPIDGVKIHQSFGIRPRRAVRGLLPAVQAQPPDWLIVQYNPFSFGDRGFNPYLPGVLRRIRKTCRRTRLAVMVHEMFMPALSPKLAVMSLLQRWQFAAATGLADCVFFSTGPWADGYKQKFPRRRAIHLPVGSNLPRVQANRSAVRATLGIPAGAIVLGTFGGGHASKLPGHIAAAARKLRDAGKDVRILSIGPGGPDIRAAMPELPIIDMGTLGPQQVSTALQAIDIYCCPFIDGVSTRRSSFMAALQHGLATVSTRAYHTDAMLLAQHEQAFLLASATDPGEFAAFVCELASNDTRRQRLGTAAGRLFDEKFSTRVLADVMFSELMKVPSNHG
jgi:glycosyltransferase involved in cell wall biosynthesis